MAQLGKVFRLRTDKDTHFTGGLVQNAQEQENIGMPVALGGGNGIGTVESRLRMLSIVSDQQLSWELWLWGNSTGNGGADIDQNVLLGRWLFNTSDGKQIAGAGAYYYYIDGLDHPYRDLDDTGQLHVSLVNRSATAKNAGATGEGVVEFTFELPLGW